VCCDVASFITTTPPVHRTDMLMFSNRHTNHPTTAQSSHCHYITTQTYTKTKASRTGQLSPSPSQYQYSSVQLCTNSNLSIYLTRTESAAESLNHIFSCPCSLFPSGSPSRQCRAVSMAMPDLLKTLRFTFVAAVYLPDCLLINPYIHTVIMVTIPVFQIPTFSSAD
jgi:hypothetical protein